MWALYVDELRRRRMAAVVSVFGCMALGVGLAALAGASSGRTWALWGLLGGLSASTVSLALPLKAVSRSEVLGRRSSGSGGPSVLGRAAARRLWRSRLVPTAVGVFVGVVLYSAGLWVYRSAAGASRGPVPAPAALPSPPAAEVPQPPPAPEPTITIGDHILVPAAESRRE
jgi:hypothetical protein